MWLDRYEPDQYRRVEERLLDVLTHGIAAPGSTWRPTMLDMDAPVRATASPDARHFLLAATRLINQLGYRGASVQRIASELNVTKGSFYHHLDAKDDLVAACYTPQLRHDHRRAATGRCRRGSHWHRLSSAIATLLDIQFAERGPLLRTSALSSLSGEVRAQMVDRSNRIARRYAGTIMDGVGEGSIRAVDALIAAQALMAIQNAAFDMRKWAGTMERPRAIALYASTILYGMFDDRFLN